MTARRIIYMLISALLMLSCAAPAYAGEAPKRVVSLDYCADQYVLGLADPDQILALSGAAESEYSYFAARAKGVPKIRATAEEILLADPDMVVRHWGGGYRAGDMMRRFHLPMVNIAFGATFEIARQNLLRVGQALGQEARADMFIAEMDRRLKAVKRKWEAIPRDKRPGVYYVTPSGVTTGAGSFVHDTIEAAGLRNMAAEQGVEGWRQLDLEHMVMTPPDGIVGSMFDLETNHNNQWTVARHRVLRHMLKMKPTVLVPSREMACSAWFFTDAVDAINQRLGRTRLVENAQDPGR